VGWLTVRPRSLATPRRDMPGDTTYQEGCRGTIDAARALGHDGDVAEAIAQSRADTGIECESDVFVCDEDDSCADVDVCD
jgi:hypothetical protein